ncbi:agtpbp1, partial [Symbiodinium necroappetens]
VMEPPIGDEAVAENQPFSDSMSPVMSIFSKQRQLVHAQIDPDKFAINSSVSLVDTIKGSYRATDYHNLRSIVENDILPGAPWDNRNQITKYRDVWLCSPEPNHHYAFETIEKVLDYELEDDVAMTYAIACQESHWFAIKNMRPEQEPRNSRNAVMRCFSVFKSCGKFQSTASRRKSPLEVPTEEISNAMEEATAARSSLVSIHDDEDDDARTMAESEMEVDSDMDVDEVEPDEAQQDVDENENQDEIAELRPVLVQENTHIIVPVLTQARKSIQVPYYPNSPTAYCIYARLILFAYMAYVVVHCMYKSWVKTMRRTTLQYDQILSNCANGDRYVVQGKWPTLCDIDPDTKVSRDVTDEGLLSYIRGARQKGIQRAMFNPSAYIDGKVTGKTMFAMLRPPPTESHDYLFIDPVAIMMITGLTTTTTTTIELHISYDIVIPAKYTAKLTRQRLETQRSQHPGALLHIQPGDYLNHGQIGIGQQNPEDRLRIVQIPASVTKAKQEGKLLTITNVTANVIEASVADGKVTITDDP